MEPQTKITLKIYKPLLKAFDLKVQRLCLKRDAFLNRLLAVETPRLKEDLNGLRQSTRAHRYSSGELKRLAPWPINVVVDQATADALNEVVTQANVSRDAFANFLIWFLVATDEWLELLDLPSYVTSSDFEDWVEPLATTPLRAFENFLDDPLRYLQQASNERHGVGLYRLNFWKKLHGFNIFMNDEDIPGTPEYEAAQMRSMRELDALFSSVLADGQGVLNTEARS